MENEDREFRRTCEEEEEYCTCCHTVYAAAEGCLVCRARRQPRNREEHFSFLVGWNYL